MDDAIPSGGNLRTIIIAGLILGLTTAASAQFTARGNFSSVGFGLDYDPSTACTKPIRPYGIDRYAWQTYRIGGERYLQCLEDAANSDMRYAQAQIQNGYEDAVDELMSEVRRGY